MKILIIGGTAALAAMVAQQLAERHPEHNIEAREASDIERENLAGYDFLLETRPEPVVMPIMAPEREAWPESISESRSRYHRTPKWKRNQSGSKFF